MNAKMGWDGWLHRFDIGSLQSGHFASLLEEVTVCMHTLPGRHARQQVKTHEEHAESSMVNHDGCPWQPWSPPLALAVTCRRNDCTAWCTGHGEVPSCRREVVSDKESSLFLCSDGRQLPYWALQVLLNSFQRASNLPHRRHRRTGCCTLQLVGFPAPRIRITP